MENPIIEQSKRHAEKFELIRKAAENLPIDLAYWWLSYDTICARIPHQLDAIRAFRKALPKEWRPRSYNFARTMDDGCFVWSYHNVGIDMTVYTEIAVGQTCHRVKVGEKTTPVYKIVCE